MAENREAVLSPEEEKFVKSLALKSVAAGVTHPLTAARTLIQLGHEPFPLSTGRVFICAGRNAYFLPNVFSYTENLTQALPRSECIYSLIQPITLAVHQLAKDRGVKVLFTGIDSALVGLAVQGIAAHKATQFIDTHYPTIGGPKENEDVEEEDLTDHDSFRRALRHAMRDTVIRCVAVTAARPFTVVMIRQIAQLIGNETKYTSVFPSLRLIGLQEGPGGLFSGLVPQIVGETIVIFGVHFGIWAMERAILRSGVVENVKNEKGKKASQPNQEHMGTRFRRTHLEHSIMNRDELKDLRTFVHAAIPFVLNSFGHPYSVVSAVMGVVGSGLAVSFLPYSPTFSNWHNAWDYLHPHGLKRGARLFLREQTGAVTVGADRQLYASTKYFA
ncbi:hypothetical protein WR25_18378 [Diploscapter pachys]|uniref:Uncharacterized protein n=1 Tax=Diploscapter pachys TaxID=2018661 RepID=A0A2A2JZB0_9BILA|nr:hypothetical protein WR25_18378 [Diploscapter pachys]